MARLAMGGSPEVSRRWAASEAAARLSAAAELLEGWWGRAPKRLRRKRAKARKKGGARHSGERHQQFAVAVVSSALLARMEHRLAAPLDAAVDRALCGAGRRLALAAADGRTEDTLAATRLLGSALLFCPAELRAAASVLRHGLELAALFRSQAGSLTAEPAEATETLTLHTTLVEALDAQGVAAAGEAVDAAEVAIGEHPTDVELWRLRIAALLRAGRREEAQAAMRDAGEVFQAPKERHELAVSFAARAWSAAPNSTTPAQAPGFGLPRPRGGWSWSAADAASEPARPRCTIARVHHSELSPAE